MKTKSSTQQNRSYKDNQSIGEIMNRCVFALILIIGCAKISWSTNYTFELLQVVASNEVVAKVVKSQEEDGFQFVGIIIRENNHAPGCEQFDIMFKSFEVPDDEAVRKVTVITQLKLKKGKVKVLVKKTDI
jgi:hypothetical protein